MNQSLIPVLIAVVCGLFQPLQAALNGTASQAGLGPTWTGAISAMISSLSLLLVSVLLLSAAPPRPVLLWSHGYLVVLGGTMGGFIVSGLTFAAPRLGTVQTFLFYFAALAIMAVAIDRVGLFGQPVRNLAPIQTAGSLLIVLGIVLLRVKF